MRKMSAILVVALAVASACSPDDEIGGDREIPGGSFNRILDGERQFIPDPGNPEFDDNPCFGLDGTDILQAFECPFVDLSIPRDDLVFGTPDPEEPDLVISSHQAAVLDDDNVVHVVTIRNIGNADADFGESLGPDRVVVQFFVSLTPVLDTGSTGSFMAAGGTELEEMTLVPGDEFELVFAAGTGIPDGFDYTDFNYDIGILSGSPANDSNPDNNVSVTPLIPAP